jgi:hypothetical protein
VKTWKRGSRRTCVVDEGHLAGELDVGVVDVVLEHGLDGPGFGAAHENRLLSCPRCGGPMRIIAFILEREAVERILRPRRLGVAIIGWLVVPIPIRL